MAPPLLVIFGGVALLLFGVRYLRKGLDRLFGQRLGVWMQRLAARRGLAFMAGLVVSVLAPSSTTMSLLAVQTVQAGKLTARQMLTIVLGANIGLTVMVFVIALDLQDVAPILLLFGVVLFQFTKSNRSRGIGQVVLAVGFILLGIDIMKGGAANIAPPIETATAALVTDAPDPETVDPSSMWEVINYENLQQHPSLIAALAAITAMVLQSSTATIGLVIGLAATERMSFATAVPVVLGANVGLAITTLIVGWRLIEPRRLALANLLLKGTVAVAILILLSLLGRFLPEPTTPAGFGLAIAGVHTGYNVLVALVGLPTVGFVTRLIERVVPTPVSLARKAFGPRYISGGPIGGVALALGQSRREITHMSELVRGMLRDAWIALTTNDEKLARDVGMRDDKIDLLDRDIKQYLTTLVKEEAGESDADEQMRQLRYLTELETIGDIIDKNVTELVLKKIRIGAEFSREGAEELQNFYEKVAENVMIAETAFTTRDRTLAQQLVRHKERIEQYERELRDHHFARLNAGHAESHETSAIHLDLLTHLKRINSCVSHVAFAILEDNRTKESTIISDGGE